MSPDQRRKEECAFAVAVRTIVPSASTQVSGLSTVPRDASVVAAVTRFETEKSHSSFEPFAGVGWR